MARPDLPLPQRRNLFETMRRDLWWGPPMITLLVLLAFIIYGTWAAYQNEHYLYLGEGAGAKANYHADYLSPMYAPVLLTDAVDKDDARERGVAYPGYSAITGQKPEWWPWIIPFSPAFLILWAPGGFRLTCYYYRGAYYKAFWGDPPACAVGEPKFRGENYRGEQALPLVLQNVHRYFMYLAVAFIFFLGWEAWRAMWFTNPETDTKHFGIGVGTLVLTINVILLAGYTFGCHSLRHVIGGWRDSFSNAAVSRKSWECVSCLNRKHMQWAWASLIWVGFSDVYVRLVSMGVWTDFRFF